MDCILTFTHSPMELDVGEKNLRSFINKGFEHIHLTPNSKAMKKINKLGFIKKGSILWLVSFYFHWSYKNCIKI